jgi:8-oxo-dGTP diphosphatase
VNPAQSTDEFDVLAAGGVPWRRGGDGVEVLVVHRPKYDDWTFPKGKLDAGESFEDAAHREVEEETGMRCRLGEELPNTTYRDNRGRSKLVRYWEMSDCEGTFHRTDEVDEVRWVGVKDVERLLSYDRDREILRALQV